MIVLVAGQAAPAVVEAPHFLLVVAQLLLLVVLQGKSCLLQT